MSSTIDNTECPLCGGDARTETNTNTLERHSFCTEPGCPYDSDDYDDYDED